MKDEEKQKTKDIVTSDTGMALQRLFLSKAKYAFKNDMYLWKQFVGHKVFLVGMSFEMNSVEFISLMSHLSCHKSFH